MKLKPKQRHANISNHTKLTMGYLAMFVFMMVGALYVGYSPFSVKVQAGWSWEEPCKALWQTTFNCTWRLGGTQWAMFYYFHAVISSSSWWILRVHRSASNEALLASLRIQLVIQVYGVTEAGIWQHQFMSSRVLVQLSLQARVEFQSCNRTTKQSEVRLFHMIWIH